MWFIVVDSLLIVANIIQKIGNDMWGIIGI